MVKTKGFTLIELIAVIAVILFIFVFFVGVFVLPWALDKYVGNDVDKMTGYASIKQVVMDENGEALLSAGEQIRIEMKPSFLSSEQVKVVIDNPAPGMQLRKRINAGEWLLWTPNETGTYKTTVHFLDSTRNEKVEWTFIVVE